MNRPLVEEKFGSYRLTHLLGKGGMASVYRAVRSGPMGFAKQVAIKRLHSSLTRDSAILKALVNEARIGGQLKHPNIVEIYEFNRVDDTYYLAMEFIDGWTLDRVMQLAQRYQLELPTRVALDMAMQVCEGLHYAHTLESLEGVEVRLVHRDIKPANIIVGRDGVTKIMDFGIAKADTNLFKTTLVDTTKGTPHYMSPEQVAGDPNLTAVSDIFAMGSLIYELISGKILFEGNSLASVLFAVSRAEVDQQIDSLDRLVPGIGEILAICLARDPASRFPSARALQRALIKLDSGLKESAWTTENFMYTLRSKLLEDDSNQNPADSSEEIQFAPLISAADLSVTSHAAVEAARRAADAEINKLQSQYLNEAMDATMPVAELEESSLADTLLPLASETKGTPQPQQHSRGLLLVLGAALLIILGVIASREPAQQPATAAEFAEQAKTALDSDPDTTEIESTQAPTALPTGPATKGKNDAAQDFKPSQPSKSSTATAQPVAAAPSRKPTPARISSPTVTAREEANLPAKGPDSRTAKGAQGDDLNEPEFGKLGVRASSPSSVVFVDGTQVGKTPLLPFELSAGEHEVRLECATAGINASKSIQVTIEAGKTFKLGKYNFPTEEWN